MLPDEGPGGALAASIANQIQMDFFSTPKTAQTFLPPERSLTDKYKVSRTTMRKALGQLKLQGLIRAEHGRGYRILKRSDSKAKAPRIAVLQASDTSTKYQGRTSQFLIDAMQRQSLKRKWQVLNIDIEDLSANEIITELVDANVQAVGMVVSDQEIIEALLKANIPCVSLENSGKEFDIDYIYQDNISGARQATSHLVSKGHQKFAWVGPIRNSFTSYLRWSGANSHLIENTLSINPECIISDHQDLQESIKKMLSPTNRPTAILALWASHTTAVLQAADELKLKLGKDIDVVGWCNQIRYQNLINDVFPKKMKPAMIVWSPDKMAEVAVDRLLLNWQEPDTQPLHIAVPTKLILP